MFQVNGTTGLALPTEHFRGVEQFQELSSSLGFIRSKAAVRVSHAKKLQRRQGSSNKRQDPSRTSGLSLLVV